MRSFAIIFFLLYSIILSGQTNYAKEADYKAFLKTKTLVVLENKLLSSYNETIRKVVEQIWTITPYEFITTKEFEIKKHNKNYSFLMLSDATLEVKGSMMQYNFLNLILGEKVASLNDMPDLGSFPICYSDQDKDDFLYKIGGMLQFMQFFVRYNINHPNTSFINLIKNINSYIGNKEIWLLKTEVDEEIDTKEKIKNYYQGIVKLATTEEIEDAIANKKSNIVFLHKIGNKIRGNICWKVLINIENGEPLYFDQYMIDTKHIDAFTAEDFTKLKYK